MRVVRLEPSGPVVLVPRARALFAPLAALLLAAGAVVPGPAVATATWSRNLYVSSAFVYQDPYYTACTAAATMTMLNIVAARGTGGPGFSWTPSRVKNSPDPANTRDMVSILAFARGNDTLRATSVGSDAHGWRNALNYYGWGRGAMTDPSRMVYLDRAYRKLGGALRAAVTAIARRGMPVGILGWAGGHAQIMTGYVVTGANPAVSNDFTVRYVYLSDPLRKDRLVNRRLSVEQLRSGALRYRFQRYREADSPYDDPYTTGTLRSSVTTTRGASEWYHRWVIVAPVRSGVTLTPPGPTATPPPDPSASAEPPSGATPTPDVTPPPTKEPSVSASPGIQSVVSSPSPATEPATTPTPAATASPTPTQAAATPPPTSSPPPDPTPTAAPSAAVSTGSPPVG